MKHLIYFDGKEHSVTTERPYTHVVIGQRDQKREREAAKIDELQALTHTKLTQEQWVFLEHWTREAGQGRYALRVLDWTESEDAARMSSICFYNSGWINVEVREKADKTIPYA